MGYSHEEVAAEIDKGTPGFAQMEHDNVTISWHPVLGGHSFSGWPGSWNVTQARYIFIEKWAVGEARVSPGTFSADDIEKRASQWEHGNGWNIGRGHTNPQFARQIRSLINSL